LNVRLRWKFAGKQGGLGFIMQALLGIILWIVIIFDDTKGVSIGAGTAALVAAPAPDGVAKKIIVSKCNLVL